MPQVYTPSGWPAVSTPVLRALAGKPGAAKKALAELDGADLALPEGGAQASTKPYMLGASCRMPIPKVFEATQVMQQY